MTQPSEPPVAASTGAVHDVAVTDGSAESAGHVETTETVRPGPMSSAEVGESGAGQSETWRVEVDDLESVSTVAPGVELVDSAAEPDAGSPYPEEIAATDLAPEDYEMDDLDTGGEVESVEVDASALDAGGLDSGELDTGELDTGGLDSEQLDAGAGEVGDLNAADVGSGEIGSGEIESAGADSGKADSAGVDSGEVDARISDDAAHAAGSETDDISTVRVAPTAAMTDTANLVDEVTADAGSRLPDRFADIETALADIDRMPLPERVEAFSTAHSRLQDALTSIDEV